MNKIAIAAAAALLLAAPAKADGWYSIIRHQCVPSTESPAAYYRALQTMGHVPVVIEDPPGRVTVFPDDNPTSIGPMFFRTAGDCQRQIELEGSALRDFQ